MLGLVIFPWANYEENSQKDELPATLAQQLAKKSKQLFAKSLKELERDGWPHWEFGLDNDNVSGKTTTLELLLGAAL